MRFHFIHRYGQWEDYDQKMLNPRTGREWWRRMQLKTCAKCNKTVKRIV